MNGFSKTLYMTVEQMANHAKRYSKAITSDKDVTVEKLLNLGRSMVNNSVGNNTIYDVVSAIIADLNADKYGIYADVLLKHEVINDMKKFIEKVD